MAGFSADIELVRPAFTAGDTPGVDVPRLGIPGTVTAGALLQYEDQPLVLYRYNDEDAAIIQGRFALHLGASLDFSKRFGARIVLPMAVDIAGPQADFSAAGFGSGDVLAGARAFIWRLGPVDLGAHADLVFPTGAQDAWKGETGIRFVPGLLASAGVGPVALHTDTALTLRQDVDTGADFALSNEWVENAALVATVWDERVWLHAGVTSRIGLGSGTTGEAEVVAETLVGAQFRPLREWTVDVGLGRGLTEGYGTSRIRAVAGISWTHSPKPPAPEPVVAMAPPIEDIPDELIIEKIALAPPEPPALARVEQDQIVIRDPIQFELAKDVILPISQPTLQFVGQLMAEHPEIAHLVIEGHASEEGSFYYNYDLAKKRADAIWRALVEAGVSPVRMSTRSMGEVEPVVAGESEAQLAENRRVVFHIVKRLAPGELPAPYKLDIRQPWTGDPETLPAPPPVAIPEPPKPVVPPDDTPNKDDFPEEDEP